MRYVLELRTLCEYDRELYLKAGSCEPGCENLYLDETYANLMWSIAYEEKGKRKNYIIECDGIFCGYCNVEEGNTPGIGICLLTEFQNKGIGSRAIKLLWDKVADERQELQYFVARVENDNIHSIKMFERLGGKKITTKESDALLTLRRLAQEDNTMNNVLQGMEDFHNRIIQYAVSFN